MRHTAGYLTTPSILNIEKSLLSTEEDSGIDYELLKGCIKQKPKAQGKLYKSFYGYAMSIALSYTNNRDEAADILNEAFFKVFKNIKKYKKESSFKSWLRRIVVNTAIDHYRSNKKFQQNVEIESAGAQEYDVSVIDQLNADDILNQLQKLPEHYRVTFLLYEIEGYSHEEIGQQLSVSESTSRSNLTRAKKKLRELVTNCFTDNYNAGV